jgi:hypothetical protein
VWEPTQVQVSAAFPQTPAAVAEDYVIFRGDQALRTHIQQRMGELEVANSVRRGG